MPSLPKTSQGPAFLSLTDLLDWLDNGSWVYWNSRPRHPSVIYSLPLRTVRSVVFREEFYRCYRFRSPKEPYRTESA